MKKKKLIVVCGSLYRRRKNEACSCGSDLTLEEEIENMIPYCEKIDIVSLFKKELPKVEKINNKILVHRCKIREVEKTIEKLHEENGKKTDFLVTQLLLCDIGLKKSTELKIPSIYYVMSIGSKINISKKSNYSPAKVVAISQFVANWIKDTWGRDDVIISYPTFNNFRKRLKSKKIEDNSGYKFDFLMVNPNVVKGGNIFLELVKKFSNLKFGVVLGWHNLKRKNGKFDLELMKLMSAAHGETKIYIPKEINFPKLPNLKILEPITNIENILINTKVLLFPSQWEEAFGRVIVEAGLLGKIVIASNRGGIPEAMRIAGFSKEHIKNLLVNNYSDVKSWERKINWYLRNAKKIPKPKPKIFPFKAREILSY